jgi:hypothetical protein
MSQVLHARNVREVIGSAIVSLSARGLRKFTSPQTVALYLVAGCIVSGSGIPSGAAVESAARVEETPDLMQSESRAGLPFEGAPYCGPVAASNSLIYLSKHGYPRLTAVSLPDARAQGELSLQLSKLMKTTRLGGTTPDGFMVGLRKYVGERGYVVDSLQYQGGSTSITVWHLRRCRS